ncbi:hypothetical protein MGU_04618 [Metarhizium guizhouense ARSEF 977]|uniref:DUF300 domain protein n=1 Tax=Metarhizium guizhouense (strain ARSEF 977) TaxID=1276136 RepID=A0A0B4GZI0_METGA|nr:hypothetical protein MGU_04618 [Metarhizium guizhouense ARSEF 977]
MNLTCNTTLEDMKISPGSERLIAGRLNFHDLARVISASSTLIATALSLYLIWMHALHYTQPREQRYIIRILFMVPVYSISSYLQLEWYWHAIYFQVIADCYEAFAIASFFALLCHYVAPDIRSQKSFFRELHPIKPWVMPVNWFAKCCGGERGIWRLPKSGLTWFNIIWIGVYHYCFIRVAMTISAVVSQYFKRYCESSNSPVFGHIWIIVINAIAVTIAMYCLIQFYVQLKEPLAEHKLFVKIVAIKLVVFLSFWQASAISVGTSTLRIVHPNEVIAYPDLKVGIPALLLCVEMAMFAILHLWAFPYAPYTVGAPRTYYPNPNADKASPAIENERQAPSGGSMGLMALYDALNLWDFIKAFGRGMRWLCCGVKRRKEDISYRRNRGDGLDMDNLPDNKEGGGSHDPARSGAGPPGQHDEYGSVTQAYEHPSQQANPYYSSRVEERAGLMDNAQPNPEARDYSTAPPQLQRDASPYEAFGANRSREFQHHDTRQQTGVMQGRYNPYDGTGGGLAAPTRAQAAVSHSLWGPGQQPQP